MLAYFQVTFWFHLVIPKHRFLHNVLSICIQSRWKCPSSWGGAHICSGASCYIWKNSTF